MIINQFKSIKKQTRLALPDDDSYLYRLGVALYGFASINSFMTEIICQIDKSQDRTTLLSDATSGKILYKFKETLEKIKNEGKYTEIHNTMSRTAAFFDKFNLQRNDFVHSYPITNNEKQQILHRRKDNEKKYFEIDNAFLDQFICELQEVSNGLYEIRNNVNKGSS
jgi:hypothetical protein